MSLVYSHPISTETVDGGYAGELVVTVADGPDNPAFIFVDSDLLKARLMLTSDEVIALCAALVKAAATASGANRR